MRNIVLLAALGGLAACADPLDQIDRLSDVALTDAQVATLAPAPGDQAGDAPVLPGLLAAASEDVSAEADPEAEAELAATPQMAETATAPRGFLGLFARPGGTASGASTSAAPAGNGPDSLQVAAGQVLPYGEIATVCGLPDAALGPAMAAASDLTIHDSAPGSIALRSHFVTGFPDGCARQFTAALALFGDVGTHEIVRYQPSNAGIAYTETDIAYEAIKGRICGAPQGQPCGDRLEQLGRNTTFVTVYESFGSAPVWAEILIHDGAVIAMDMKRN